jgi:hypothetical protein
MKSRMVRQILLMGTAGASAMVVVILASVKSLSRQVVPDKSRLCLLSLATALCRVTLARASRPQPH